MRMITCQRFFDIKIIFFEPRSRRPAGERIAAPLRPRFADGGGTDRRGNAQRFPFRIRAAPRRRRGRAGERDGGISRGAAGARKPGNGARSSPSGRGGGRSGGESWNGERGVLRGERSECGLSGGTWCRESGSNRHGAEAPRDFKSLASTRFAIPARASSWGRREETVKTGAEIRNRGGRQSGTGARSGAPRPPGGSGGSS
jgi:hypothetical protein